MSSLLALSLLACPATDDKPAAEAPDLAVSEDALALTELALEAVAMSPSWIQDDLVIAFDRQSAEHQDELAQLLVDNDEPWTWDEVAFTIAHTGPEVLSADWFHPQLLLENARLTYEHDAQLDYVEIIDVGEPGVDADYYSVTAYQVETADGERVERQVERDIYYWYVVHPRLEDESPMYVDGWYECGSAQCPVSPEDGRFWRDFLWSGAREDCPEGETCQVLDEILPGVEVLWKEKLYDREDNGAVGSIVQFVLDVMDFGVQADQVRSVQPNAVYALFYGNCGEHSDITGASARTALIPNQNASAWGNDHTWNEFWDDGWMQWEPVNTYVGHWYYYADANGDYYRSSDKLDNDCDGAADNGGGEPTDDLWTGDHDEDGVSLADGDCNDADPLAWPGADELDNGKDDDCDGVADDGTDTSDADEDGYSIADGDCDDTRTSVYPGAEDLIVPSSNRVQAISVTRGDTLVTQRTESYGKTVQLEVTMTDEDGTPIDGARITMYGRVEVYGYYNSWWRNTVAVTDLDGRATLTLGEANDYAWRVDHSIGSFPSDPDQIRHSHSWPYDSDVITLDDWIPATMPAGHQGEAGDLVGENKTNMEVTIEVTPDSHRIQAPTWFGTSTVAHDGGRITRFVVDESNYEDFVAGESFEAMELDELTEAATTSLDLASRRPWWVVLANIGPTSTTMIGDLQVSATGDWGTVEVDERYIVGPGEHVAVALTPR